MARSAPPPLPPRPLLQGGRRRSRLPRLIAIVAILAAPVGVVAAAWLSLGHEAASGGTSGPPLAVRSPPVAFAPSEPHESVPMLDTEPVPDVRLGAVDAFHARLRRPPRAGLVFDVDTGEVLWRRRPLVPLPMASLTKIMTALLAVERGRPDDPVRITPAALHYSGSGVGLLPRGRRVRFETLLNGMLIVSGNDAAIALAVHLAGSERRFVRRMNARAGKWGLGFHFPIKGGRLFLYGHNPLIRMGYPGAIGLKTGYTEAAGRCFVGVVRRNGRRLAVILLNSRDPTKHAPKLLDAALASL